ncbi:hypothetical protein [Chryseobacterium sp. CT-SW4]|uniref:hypothetical protein n=1 Tax=Chryseobacterium sp. SW-1 TaxID=3157343 RepID=UPI003B021E16
MKKLIILCLLFICLFCCKKKSNNEHFVSDEIYNTITQSVDGIHKDISKTDNVFYVFNRYDTLIIMSSESENILRPTYSVQKLGYFNYKNNKIIITKPYKAEFDIINKKNKLKSINNDLKPPYYDGNDYQKGMVYKIIDLNHLKLIEEGNLMKYFKPMAEYEYLPPPPPTDLK